MTPQLIACVLVPNFLAHVAMATQHSTASKPLIVAASLTDRAPVIAVHPEAARYGIRIGMLVWAARRQCTDLLVTTVAPEIAEEAATAIERVLHEYTDELARGGRGCWTLGLYALGRDFQEADAYAQTLQQVAQGVLPGPVAVGMGRGAMLAQIAATFAATAVPSGRKVVLPGEEPALLNPLPVRMLPEVGTQTEQVLAKLGVTTIGQLQRVPPHLLVEALGGRGKALQRSLAELHRPTPQPVGMGEILTICSAWQTDAASCGDTAQLLAQAQILTERVGRSLRARNLGCGRLTVRVQWVDGAARERSYHFTPRRDLDRQLHTGGQSVLLALLGERRLQVEQLVVTLDDLGPLQRDLFAAPDERARGYQRAVDAVKRRWGTGAILQAGLLRVLRPLRF